MSLIGGKKIFSKRIDNLAFNIWQSDNGEGIYFSREIVKYEPNYYYYHKDDFKEVPYRPGNYVRKDDKEPYYSFVHESCFKNEETCYTIASFREDWDGDYLEGYELVFCGDRPATCLDKSEDKTFMEIVRYAYNYLKIERDKQSCDD